MNRRFVGSSLAALSLLGFASSSDAHHPPHFDRCQLLTIVGEVVRVDWRNPHVKVSIKAEDGMTYDVVWRSIQQLSLAGVQKDGLTVGDHVTAKGSKQAEDAAHVSLLLTEIHKSGGVQWSQPPQGC